MRGGAWNGRVSAGYATAISVYSGLEVYPRAAEGGAGRISRIKQQVGDEPNVEPPTWATWCFQWKLEKVTLGKLVHMSIDWLLKANNYNTIVIVYILTSGNNYFLCCWFLGKEWGFYDGRILFDDDKEKKIQSILNRVDSRSI